MDGREQAKKVDTGGGTYVEGGVNTGGGDFVAGDKIVQAPQAGVQSLHQLPEAPEDFTGRVGELKRLERQLTGGWMLLCGSGGTGKTTLALAAAGRLKGHYADAQIFVELRGHQGDLALGPEQALSRVIRAFYPVERLPEGLVELAGLYRSVLSGRRVLVILDDAAGPEPAANFLPPAGCLVLITSRRRFSLPGLNILDVGVLTEDEAAVLVRKIARRVGREDAMRLGRACGCLPLGVEVAASLLRQRVDMTAGELLRRMQDAGKRLKLSGIGEVVQTSYELLDKTLQQRWRTLAVFFGTFERAAVAAIWELDEDEAGDVLGELLGYGLVGYAAGRYRLHDLERDFAGLLLSEDERAGAGLHHGRYYCDALRRAEELYECGGEDALDGLELYDLEAQNIHAGQVWAARFAEQDEQAAALCSKYAHVGAKILQLRLYPEERIAWSQAGLAAARRLEDRDAESVHLSNLGLVYNQMGEIRRAIEYYQQSLGIARELGNRKGEGIDLGNLGTAYHRLGEIGKAIRCYEEQLKIASEVGYASGAGNALTNLGLAYIEQEQWRAAVACFEQAQEVFRQAGDLHGEGAVWGSWGLVCMAMDEYPQAVECFEQKLHIAVKLGDQSEEARARSDLGDAYLQMGQAERAIEFYSESLALDEQSGDVNSMAFDYWLLAQAHEAQGDRQQAILAAEQVLRLCDQAEGVDVEEVQGKLAEWRSGV